MEKYRRLLLVLVLVLCWVNCVAAQTTYDPCTEPDSDRNGNGWGWQNNATCEVVNGYENHCSIRRWYGGTDDYPFCVGAVNYSGWGWENSQSCVSRGECANRNGFVVLPPPVPVDPDVPEEPEPPVTPPVTPPPGGGPVSVGANGEPLNIANSPLENGVAPSPNVLIVADDSGSMDWEMVVSQDAAQKQDSLDGIILNSSFIRYNNLFGFPSGRTINYDNHHAVDDNYSGRVVPPLSAVSNLSSYSYTRALRDQLAGVWRLRNHHYNRIYYNPSVRYDPWPGFANSNPASAWVDPSKDNIRVNLTLNSSSLTTDNLTVHVPKNTSWDDRYEIPVYLPFYYTWAASGPDDDYIDISECGRLVEIKADAVERNCVGAAIGGAIYPMRKSVERSDCADPLVCTAAEDLQNFANWFSFYRRREFVAKTALANVVSALKDIRVGYATINAEQYPSGEYPLLGIANDNDVDDLLEVIYNTRASVGGTQLLTALDRSGRYFACQSGHIMTGFNCPTVETRFASCQQNYTVMMTDGFWQANSADWNQTGVITTNPAMADHDSDSNSVFAGGAFADYNRSGPSTSQWLTLADIAMYYFKTDLAPAVANKVSPTNLERTRMTDPTYWDDHETLHQHMNTFTIGFGVFNDSANAIGSVDSNNNWVPPLLGDSVNWPSFSATGADPDKLEDLKHAALNGRGMYYSANDAKALTENLVDIFGSIKQGAGAVGAVSFNSQQIASDSVAYAASFNSRFNSGDVVAYRIDPTSGLISTAANNIVWRAAPLLKARIDGNCAAPGDSRNILSFERRGANSSGIDFNLISGFITAEQMQWLRGQSQNEMASRCNSNVDLRSRPNGDGVLGDIVHSRPLFIGPPGEVRNKGVYPSGSSAYQIFKEQSAIYNRQKMVIVGANDGLFHMFDAANGNEIMAYAPQRLAQGFDGNNRLADLTDPDYAHQYYVDLSPAVNDVFIKPSSIAARSWQTVAVGGYRAGGRGYFALNISRPSQFAVPGEGTENVMWEFSDLDDNRLGNTFSPPLLAMTNEAHSSVDQGNKWRAIFGNGYNSTDGIARLFLLDIEAGYDGWDSTQDYTVVDASAALSSGQTKNGLGIPRGIDVDGNGSVDYVYAGDLQGNLYRFDLTSSAGTVTSTKIFTARSAGGVTQPITTQPLVVRHPTAADEYVVIFTTGSWITREDAESIEIQSIYGLSDRPTEANPSVHTRSSLQPRYLKNVLVDGATERVIKGEELVWSSSVRGWYFDLDARAAGVDPDDAGYASEAVVHPGERAVRNLVARGGYVFANTLFPSSGDSCSSSLGGAVMAFNPLTGLLDKAILDFNNDGVFDQNGDENIAGLVTDTSLSDSAMIADRLVYQETDLDGVVAPRSVLTNTNQDTRTGRLSWTQLK